MGKKVLIVGGVAGGASAAARLRRLDESAEIIVFERGEYISYANCGLPYHVGDVIKSRNALLLQTPEAMRAKYRVDVRIRQEVTSIDREKKTVTVEDRATGEVYEETYDTLLLSTGSSPVKPPIPGIDSPGVHTVWTVPDTDRIKSFIADRHVKKAVVVGGGFIGLEMAENLHRLGIAVTIVEMSGQVMAPLDYEMAQLLHENLEQNGVALHLNDGVSAFTEAEGTVTVHLNSGGRIPADLVILSIGVRPNNELAKAAGLKVNERGGVVVDATLRTSDPDIYAVGDVIEVEDFVSRERAMVPLAGPANKQGRMAADNIAGASKRYAGTQGTSIAKVFDLAAASTGSSEKSLKKRGLEKGRDYESVIITQNSHAGYYPGATPLTIKLLFAADGRLIFGAQIVGTDGVDKRIDTIATVMRLGGSVLDLKELELAYAPPYSSAKDPVNMAGFVAENVLTGKVAFTDWDISLDDGAVTALDVREDVERTTFSLKSSVNIPLGKLRDSLDMLDRTKDIAVFCAIGVRAYNAARILTGNGFEHVRLYPGGMNFYRSTHYRELKEASCAPVDTSFRNSAASVEKNSEKDHEAIRVDCSGLQCPGPIMKVFESMKNLEEGAMLEVSASDPGFTRDIGAWCKRTGNSLVSSGRQDGDYVALLRKGSQKNACAHDARGTKEGKTIVVFSDDLDRAMASFIIANGAAAMGRPVTMFFTFWGLNVIRKPGRQGVMKSWTESMFGAMMPRGAGKLKLSRMNMGGVGSSMMKKIMNEKHVDPLELLIEKAKNAGVKFVACTMSMDVMGVKQEELIDGVDLGGVGSYLGDAEEADVNLFI